MKVPSVFEKHRVIVVPEIVFSNAGDRIVCLRKGIVVFARPAVAGVYPKHIKSPVAERRCRRTRVTVRTVSLKQIYDDIVNEVEIKPGLELVSAAGERDGVSNLNPVFVRKG